MIQAQNQSIFEYIRPISSAYRVISLMTDSECSLAFNLHFDITRDNSGSNT